MGLVIDIVLVAILVISAIFAYKKGLIITLFSLIGTVTAIMLAVSFSASLAGVIDERIVNPQVKSYILGVVDSSSVGSSYENALEQIDVAGAVSSMPPALKSALELANIDTDEIVRMANSMTENTQAAKDNLISSIAAPISGTISRAVSVIILFIVLSIVLWVIVRLITAVFNALPLGKTINKVGGLIFGLLRGLVILFVISAVFSAASRAVGADSGSVFSQKTIDSTFVLKTVSDINPINSVLKIN